MHKSSPLSQLFRSICLNRPSHHLQQSSHTQCKRGGVPACPAVDSGPGEGGQSPFPPSSPITLPLSEPLAPGPLAPDSCLLSDAVVGCSPSRTSGAASTAPTRGLCTRRSLRQNLTCPALSCSPLHSRSDQTSPPQEICSPPRCPELGLKPHPLCAWTLRHPWSVHAVRALPWPQHHACCGWKQWQHQSLSLGEIFS